MRHEMTARRRRWAVSLLPAFLMMIVMSPPWAAPAVAAGRHDGAGGVRRAAYPTLSLVTFSSLGWTTQTVNGPNPTLDLYLPGPGDVVFGPVSQLSLVYSASPALDARHSWLSISINGAYIGSRLLQGATAGPARLTVPIPASTLIGDGSNHVQLTFGLRDAGSPSACATDPALSATVYGASALRYDIHARDHALFQPDLARLPAPFASSTASVAARLTIGLPAKPTATEIDGVGHVLARFGEDAPSQPPTATAMLAASLPREAPQGDVLLIGTPEDNPAITQLAPTAPLIFIGHAWRDALGRALPGDEGLVVEIPNPWDEHGALLMLTGNGQEGVRRAATVLGSATLRRLLHGPFALIPTSPSAPPTPQLPQGGATLDSLGYPSATLEGLGDHSTRVTFDLTQAPLKAGAFTLVYGHGATVDPALSSVRVDLNGYPLASRTLNAGDPPRVQWRIVLPADHLHVGTNVLTVRFFLGTPGTACLTPPGSSIWGVVDGVSTLTLPPTDGGSAGTPDLSLLPYPLVVDGDPRQTTLVVPVRVADMRDALNLAVLLGTLSHPDTPTFTVLTADRATPDLLHGRTVILDGLPPADAAMRRLRGQLPLQLAAGASGTPLQLAGQGATLDAAAGERGGVGLVEELPSPWDAARTAVVVSSSQPALLSAAQRALIQGNLAGTVATVDTAGRLQTFDTRTHGDQASGAPSAPARPIRLLSATGLGLLLLVGVATALRGLRP